MKKLINKVDDVEREMIEGLAKAAPKKLRKLDEGNIIVRTPKKEGKVALVSGGGSGHEPAHGGYVGSGMLDCAVAGSVFTSPTPDQIYEGIKAVATDAGVLAIVKNYTGDVLNFEMAIDMAKDEGVNADYVIVNDDVAVKDSLYTTGRRGVAGTIPLYGTAFMKAGDALKGKMDLSAEDFLTAFSASVAGIKMRGKSTIGEKTMLDALCPAERAMREAIEAKKTLKEALEAAAVAAEKGAERTKDLVATKGRASYLGERSLGHRDPGAVSSSFMLRAMADAM